MPRKAALVEKKQQPSREMTTMEQHQILDLENIGSFVGRELGVSDWISIDQKRINQFADCTDDDQWIHVDVERASNESPYGGPIAHGYLTLSLLATTSLNVFIRPAQIEQAVNYGLEHVRFVTAVKAGARVRNRISLISIASKADGRVLLRTNNTIEIEGEKKPALTAVALVLVGRANTDGR
jgi:acyl dehydratase